MKEEEETKKKHIDIDKLRQVFRFFFIVFFFFL